MPDSSVDSLAEAVVAGERRALARAITLIESSRPDDRLQARELLTRLMPHSGKAIRVGISGVPGVGKSTFIEAFGNYLIDQGLKVAVLAVDPSSAISGGSILGDKTRMEELSRRLEAFIRPSPAGETLGGVARNTRETMIAVEAAGFDVVLVETVGVGQSETAVSRMTDMFLLLLLPGGGDELQGIKRGIVELADAILINKADGDLTNTATRSASEYANALRFLHPRTENWTVPVQTCSALEGTNIAETWQMICDYRGMLEESGQLQSRRSEQACAWMWNEIRNSLLEQLRHEDALQAIIAATEAKVAAGELPPSTAATEIMEQFFQLKQ